MFIIFIDLDNTLILQKNTETEDREPFYLKRQIMQILKNHNLPNSLFIKLKTINRTSLLWNAIMNYLYTAKIDENETSSIRNEVNEVLARYEQEEHEKIMLAEETIPFLVQLSKEGYTLIMLTNTCRFELDKILSRYHLSKYFKGSITRDDVIKIKPDAEGVKKKLKELGKDAFVIIDDLDYGVMVAKEAQKLGYRSYSILIDKGKYDKRTLVRLNPNAIVNSLSEIPQLLKKLHF